MKSYTVGFIFNSTLDEVALMEKTHPKWQAGKLNGIGGKVEEGESVLECMVREAAEETGLATKKSEWKQFAVMTGSDWQVNFFGLVQTSGMNEIESQTDERVDWYNVRQLPLHSLDDIHWLVPLAREKLNGDKFEVVKVKYVK